MSLIGNLIGFGLRQVIGAVAGEDAEKMAGKAVGPVIEFVEKRFADHSKTLPNALVKANDRAWQALSIALAGDTFLDKIKVFFASGDDKGIREQVRLFLQDKNIGFEGVPAAFRKQCLTELKAAKKAGLLNARNFLPNEVARQTASFQRYVDLQGMMNGAELAIGKIADGLAAHYPNLAKLLRHRPSGGPPLLVSAFAYFFRREVETDEELAHCLLFDGLRQLSASQAKAFGEVNKALISLGDKFDQIIEQLDRIEGVVVETLSVAVETHGAVLDMQAELQRLGSLPDEVRRLMQDVMNRVSQAGMQRGEVKPHQSFSIRSEDERNAVKQLLARFRQLPDQQQNKVPALLNGLGKLQFGSQDFEGAKQTFVAVAEVVHDPTAQGEAQFNAYRALLEEKKWDDALDAIQKAASLDSQRFTPFDMRRYQPKRLLGAGGFGAAFLCHDRFLDTEVVVKSLHDSAMERTPTEVFREAQVLRQLQHPAIIGVRDCNYADLIQMTRPFIVMDYFAGVSLANFVQQRGAISPEHLIRVARQVADGMQAAHQKNILHRDLKPDNILVRKEGSNWKVKIIDFGLAFRHQAIETSKAGSSARNNSFGNSVAGTIKYAPPEQMGEMRGIKAGPYSDVYAFGKTCCFAMFTTTEPKKRHWEAIPGALHEMLEGCTEQELQHRIPNFEAVLKVLEDIVPRHVQDKQDKEDEVARQKAEHKRILLEREEIDKKRRAGKQTEPEIMDLQEGESKEQPSRKKQADNIAQFAERGQSEQEKAEAEFSDIVVCLIHGMEGDHAYADHFAQTHGISKDRAKEIEDGLYKVVEKNDDETTLALFVREALDRTLGKPTKDDTIAVNQICKQHRIDKERARQIVDETKAEWRKANPPKQERKPGEILTNSLGMKFGWIPPGTFMMGSPKEEKERRENEAQHKVRLTKGFYMGIYQVTQEQWHGQRISNLCQR